MKILSLYGQTREVQVERAPRRHPPKLDILCFNVFYCLYIRKHTKELPLQAFFTHLILKFT